MTGLREELDICAIAHQIEIKNAFLNDRLSNTLYTSSNCNTEIGAQQNKKIRQQRLSTDLISLGQGNCFVNCSIVQQGNEILHHKVKGFRKLIFPVSSQRAIAIISTTFSAIVFFLEQITPERLLTLKKKKKRERIYEGETPNRGNQKLVCLQFSG